MHPSGPRTPGTRRRRGVPAWVMVVAGVLSLVAGVGAGAVAAAVGADASERKDAADPGTVVIDTLAGQTAPTTAEPAPAAPRSPDPTPDPTPEPSEPTADPTDAPDPYERDATGLSPADHAAGLLSTETPQAASGTLVVVPGTEEAPFEARRVLRVRVEVEEGLPVDGALFAETVMATLNDPRGWGGDGSVVFSRTDDAADIRVVLASPDRVDAMCAPLTTRGVYSCGRNGHAALNFTRWSQGTEETPTGADLVTYREYLVNHEVGHLLGHQHVQCPAEGELAPIMQQQSVRAAPCVLNGWPFPGVDR